MARVLLSARHPCANIIYIMRNGLSGGYGVRGIRMAMAVPLARLLPAGSFPRQGRTGSVMEFDPYNRTELTGPWAGFAFLGNRLITPEGRELLPEDLAWLSLTACQAQEWRRMMDELRRGDPRSGRPGMPCGSKAAGNSIPAVGENVIDVATLMARRQRRLSRVMAGPDAEPPMAADTKTGPKPRARG